MEIKKKKLTQEDVFAREIALRDGAIAVRDDYADRFGELGYELSIEIGQKENELEIVYSEFSDDPAKCYDAGYVSRALFVVRRKKTDSEIETDEQLAAENKAAVEAAETEEDAEQLENDETLRVSEDALKRAVAFTEIMLVRAYRSFWTDWFSIGDGFDDIRADLDEFLGAVEEIKPE